MKTRNAFQWIGGAVLIALVVGCVSSINPVYRPGDLVFDPALLGSWRQVDSPERWQIDREGDNAYRLTYTDREGHRGLFVAHLADLEGTRFLDIYPAEMETGLAGLHDFHRVPVHSIYLVKETGSKIVLAAVDFQWVNGWTEGGDVRFVNAGGRKVLTGTTDEVQSLLVANKDRFTNEIRLERP